MSRVIDTVDYAAPGGRPVERLLVDRDVEVIFAHRRAVLANMFGGPAPPG